MPTNKIMKVMICGSRNVNLPFQIISEALEESRFVPTEEIISGGAVGIDSLAERYAEKFEIPFRLFKPDWKTHGRKAGILRNVEMVNAADAVIAIWDGESRGTAHSIEYTKKVGKPLYIKQI